LARHVELARAAVPGATFALFVLTAMNLLNYVDRWVPSAVKGLIKDELDLNMTCGASNVSFGMPDRHTIASVFLPMAMTVGMTSAIMDARTESIHRAIKAGDLMMGNDEWGANWIAAHRARQAAAEAAAAASQ
jgi:hypothetical protein